MVDAVVEDVVAHDERRVLKTRRAGVGEAHAQVAGDVDDQAAGAERRHVLVAQVDERGRGVLEGAVDDDVVLREVGRQRLASALGDHLALLAVRVVLELADPHGVDR